MVAWRQALALVIDDDELVQLTAIARSRTAPASRVERARILLAYRDEPPAVPGASHPQGPGPRRGLLRRRLDKAATSHSIR
jgi:hypothetical protein